MGSKELSKLKTLEKNLRPLIEGNIVDLIVFGSTVKGRDRPKDLDLAVLVKDEEKLSLQQISEIRERSRDTFENIDTEVLSPSELFTADITLRILMEGYSLREEDFLSGILGIKPCNIYSYSLKDLNRSEKTRFNRTLKQAVEEVGGEKIGRGVVKVPRKYSGKLEDIFSRWDVWKDTDLMEIFEY